MPPPVAGPAGSRQFTDPRVIVQCEHRSLAVAGSASRTSDPCCPGIAPPQQRAPSSDTSGMPQSSTRATSGSAGFPLRSTPARRMRRPNLPDVFRSRTQQPARLHIPTFVRPGIISDRLNRSRSSASLIARVLDWRRPPIRRTARRWRADVEQGLARTELNGRSAAESRGGRLVPRCLLRLQHDRSGFHLHGADAAAVSALPSLCGPCPAPRLAAARPSAALSPAGRRRGGGASVAATMSVSCTNADGILYSTRLARSGPAERRGLVPSPRERHGRVARPPRLVGRGSDQHLFAPVETSYTACHRFPR